jgi:hypothetical protein
LIVLRRDQKENDDMTGKTLFNLTEEMLALMEAFEDIADGGNDGQAQGLLIDFLADLDSEVEQKVDAYCVLIREYQARSKARWEECERLETLAKRDLAHAERMQAALHEHFKTTDRKKLETRQFSLTLCKNGGKQPIHVDVEASDLPAELQRVKIAADTDAIRAKLLAGETVDGCSLLERGTHLRIR